MQLLRIRLEIFFGGRKDSGRPFYSISGSKNQRERLKNYQRAKSIEKSENETKEQGEVCQETNPNPSKDRKNINTKFNRGKRSDYKTKEAPWGSKINGRDPTQKKPFSGEQTSKDYQENSYH